MIPPTLKELMKEQQALEMRKKERFCKTSVHSYKKYLSNMVILS